MKMMKQMKTSNESDKNDGINFDYEDDEASKSYENDDDKPKKKLLKNDEIYLSIC